MNKTISSRKAIYLLAGAACMLPTQAFSQDRSQDRSQDQSQEQNIDEIIILSAPFQQKATDIISTTHALGRDELAAFSGQPIGAALARLAGVDVASHGPAVGRPVIRGQSGYQIAVLENGLQSGDVSDTGNDHANGGLVYDQLRIEVLKGPSALRYGPYAGTGVVNSLSRSLDFDAQEQNHATTAYGSVADTKQAGFYSRRQLGAYWATVSGFISDSDNIRIPTHAESDAQLASEGETAIDIEQDAENTSVKLEELKAGLAWIGDMKRWSMTISQTGQNYGVPGHAHHEEEHHEEEEGAVKIDMEKQSLIFNFEQDSETSKDPFRIKFAYTDYTHTEFEGANAGTRFDRKLTELNLESPYQGLASGDGLIGFSARIADLQTNGEEAFLPSVDEENFGLYAIERFTHGSWKTELAARFDSISYDTAQTSKSFDTFNLSAGLGYQPNSDSLIGASLSLTERPPAPTELFAEGVHAAASRYERGDTDLEHEEAVALELYYRGKIAGGHASLAVFRNDYDNFIFLKDTGLEDNEQTVFAYQQGSAEIEGVEFDYSRSFPTIWGSLMTEIGYARMKGEEGNGTPLRAIPAEKLSVSLSLTKGAWDGRLDVVSTDKQTRISSGELPTAGHDRVDMSLQWTPESLPGLTVMLRGENLTDEEIRHHSSALKDLLPEPGRNFILRTSLDF